MYSIDVQRASAQNDIPPDQFIIETVFSALEITNRLLVQ